MRNPLKRFGATLSPAERDARMESEMRAHIELEAAELAQGGLAPDEARRQALLRFGGIDRYKEEARDAWPLRWLARIVADVRYGLRSLRRTPTFTLAAVIALALGIGANATVFSVIDSIAFRPLPVRAPEQLVALYHTQGEANLLNISYASFEDYRREATAFSDVIAFTEGPVNLSGRGDADVVWAAHTSDNYFVMLGVQPALGTFYGHGDLTNPVVVLSYALWKNRFGADPHIVGQTIRVNDSPFTIAGVAPATFAGTRLLTYAPSVWIPVGLHAQTIPSSDSLLTQRSFARFSVVGRMRSGTSLNQAHESVNAVSTRIAATYPDLYRGLGTRLVVNRTAINPWLAPPEQLALIGRITLFGVILVLFIACGDVANLLLARMTVRAREVAIRLSLGATRGRLVQQFLTEGVVLAALGAMAAVPVTMLGIRGLIRLTPPLDFATAFTPSVDVRVLAYSALVTIGATLLFGLAPALQAARRDAVPALRDEADARGSKRARLRNALVVAQVAVSVMVLGVAGLFARSLSRVHAADPGFRADHAVAFTLDPQLMPAYDAARTRLLYARVTARLAHIPGVQSTGRAISVPLDGNSQERHVFAEGTASAIDRAPSAEFNASAPGYFAVMGTPMLDGRDFTAADSGAATDVVIVNDVLARRLWPGESAVGKRVRVGSPAGDVAHVVGVARASNYRAPGETPRAAMWRDLERSPRSRTTIVLRTTGDARAVVLAVRSAMREIDPALPLVGLGSLRQHIALSYSAAENGAFGALSFGLLAALLAASGVYGVVSFGVSQRRREIGIRMALGAGRGEIMRLVVGHAMRMTLTGVAIGLTLAVAIPMGLSHVLYGVSPRDPVSLGAAALLFGAVAALAAVIPARRAARIEPMRALRLE